jgi:hypothetical protein
MPKWSVDAVDKDLANVDPDSVGSLYDPAIGLPPKGPYLCSVSWLKVGVTKEGSANPGAAKIVLKAEISEPPGTVKAKYNGFELFKHQNVALESEAGRVNQLLLALLDNTKLKPPQKKAVLAAFHARQVVVDDKENITKIGTWTIPANMKIGIVVRPDTDQNNEKTVGVGSFLPASQAPKGVPADEVDEDEEDAEDAEEAAEEGDEDEEVTQRQEELEGYTLAKLKTLAKSLDITVKRGVKEAELIDAILDVEFPVEDDDEPEEDESEEDEAEEEEPEEEEDDAEEEGDELDEMDRAALRKEAKALEVKVLKSMSDDDLRDALREAGWEGEPAEEAEEEEDEEPEPPAKPARRGAAKPAPKGRPAANRRAAKKSDGPAADDEPPF